MKRKGLETAQAFCFRDGIGSAPIVLDDVFLLQLV
jgi:hypothetical protein